MKAFRRERRCNGREATARLSSKHPLPRVLLGSKHFHRRALNSFGSALDCAFLADYGYPKLADFVINFAESGFGKLVRRRYLPFDTRDVAQSAIDLVRWQRPENSVHGFDFRNAMANHHDVVTGI